ncbi:MAG TPA: molecular chaperone HtpG [Clostridiales bacterium]|nr:molecular chaperone HtpG [Clostridiales bacterium]
MAKKQFKAESKRLLDLMIHSIYTHKDIFLRELISNASDAIDKLCYLSLEGGGTGLARGDFFIRIEAHKEKRLLTVSDNGIGMSKEELESNLGVIARSGSLAFKDEMEGEQGDIDIIGRFGVGFYSAFMVSDSITVISRKYGEEQGFKWQSSGADGYTITEADVQTHGTQIIMEIKQDAEDEDYSRFLNENSLASLVKKYSDYIRYPVQMEMEHRRNKNEGVEGKDPEWETLRELETLNSMVPIWQRAKKEVTDKDLSQFYQEKFFDFEDPVRTIRVDAEGIVSYKALLFIPAKASYDYYTKEYKKGLQLYSSGVLIMDRCEELVPEHFRFVRGVVDSPDLSLNISREMLQQTRQLKNIAANIEKKIRGELEKMLKDDREAYEKFWQAFGLQLKYGVVAEFGANKDKLENLLLLHSSAGEKLTTLAEYVERMKDGQQTIYYATGESIGRISSLPQAEHILEKGYEILYFTHEVDEFMAQALAEYGGKPIKSINSDDAGTEEEKKELEKQAEQSKDLLGFVKDVLKDEIKDVKISAKLRKWPVCLTAEGPLSFEMEKYLAQVQPEGGTRAGRVLELNAGHPVFSKLQALMETDKEKAEAYTKILYHQAELMAGLPLSDPAAYAGLVFGLME